MEIKVWRVFRKRQTVLSLTFVLIVVFLLYLLQTGTLRFKSEGNSLDVEQKVELNLNELDEDEEIKNSKHSNKKGVSNLSLASHM